MKIAPQVIGHLLLISASVIAFPHNLRFVVALQIAALGIVLLGNAIVAGIHEFQEEKTDAVL